MVELDVRERRGEPVLAHTTFHAARGGNLLLGDALAHLAGERFAGVDLNVDVKHPGFEARLLDDLRGAGLLERTLLSSQVTAVIDRLRMLDPHARTGISLVGKSAERRRIAAGGAAPRTESGGPDHLHVRHVEAFGAANVDYHHDNLVARRAASDSARCLHVHAELGHHRGALAVRTPHLRHRHIVAEVLEQGSGDRVPVECVH